MCPRAGLDIVRVKLAINLSTGKLDFRSSDRNFWFRLRRRQIYFPEGCVVRMLCFNQIMDKVYEISCFRSG